MTPPVQRKRENLFWIDLLRAVVSFGVIMIHVSADVITEWGVLPQDWWWAANIEDSLVRGCVPVFVMVSGALLLPIQEDFQDFFRKRLYRVMIPFIAWTLLYLLWKKHFYEPDLGGAEALRRIAGSGVHFHLWFLYILIGLYLVTPLFRIWAAHASGRDIFYFLALWLFVSSFLPRLPFRIQIPIEPAQGFIGYFVLGHFLRQYAIEKWIPGARALWAASLLVCVIGTAFLSARSHAFQSLFYDNLSPNVIFYTASFFILAKYAGPVFEKQLPFHLRSLVLSLSKASFGIYLIHPMILDALAKGRWGIVLKADMLHPVVMIPFTAAAIYFLSFAVIWVIQKIPYLKKIT